MHPFLNQFFFFAVTKILVSTGRPRSSATKTEIINLDNESLTCQDLEDFPLAIQGAVGSNTGSFPVICGGWDGSESVKQCHRLESVRWQHIANLTQGYKYIWFALIRQYIFNFVLVCSLKILFILSKVSQSLM